MDININLHAKIKTCVLEHVTDKNLRLFYFLSYLVPSQVRVGKTGKKNETVGTVDFEEFPF